MSTELGLIDKDPLQAANPIKSNVTDVSEQRCVIVCDFVETALGIIIVWVKGGVADRRLRTRIEVGIQTIL